MSDGLGYFWWNGSIKAVNFIGGNVAKIGDFFAPFKQLFFVLFCETST